MPDSSAARSRWPQLGPRGWIRSAPCISSHKRLSWVCSHGEGRRRRANRNSEVLFKPWCVLCLITSHWPKSVTWSSPRRALLSYVMEGTDTGGMKSWDLYCIHSATPWNPSVVAWGDTSGTPQEFSFCLHLRSSPSSSAAQCLVFKLWVVEQKGLHLVFPFFKNNFFCIKNPKCKSS